MGLAEGMLGGRRGASPTLAALYLVLVVVHVVTTSEATADGLEDVSGCHRLSKGTEDVCASLGAESEVCTRLRGEYRARCGGGDNADAVELLEEEETYAGHYAKYPPIKYQAPTKRKLPKKRGMPVPQDRRPAASDGQNPADPRRSQLHPDCSPYSENNPLTEGKSCKAICQDKSCTSYQEFPADKYYPKGECKLYKCPPRFLTTDSRRSEVLPDCAPFSEHNWAHLMKGQTCSGMCARKKGCRSYVSWAKGSKKYPNGECKLFKRAPKSDAVRRAQEQAKLIRALAEKQATLTKEEANRQAKKIHEKAEKRELAAKNHAAEIRQKAAKTKADAEKSAKEISSKAQSKSVITRKTATDTAKATTTKADTDAKEVTQKAVKAKKLADKKLADAQKKAAETNVKTEKFAKEKKHKATESSDKVKEKAEKTKKKADDEAAAKKDAADEKSKKALAKAAAVEAEVQQKKT